MKALGEDARRLRHRLLPYFPELDDLDDVDDDVEDGRLDSSEGNVVLRRESLRPVLFDYQSELVNRLIDPGAPRNQLVALPTGAGKTRTALVAALEGVGRGLLSRIAWLAPTVELLDQAFETASTLWLHQGNVSVLRLSRAVIDEEAGEPEISFVTPQAVYARSQQSAEMGHWSLIIFDEAHQLGASTFRRAVHALRGTATEDAGLTPLVGLSATPGRASSRETEDLVDLFRRNLVVSEALKPNPVRVLQRRGVLAALRFRALTRRDVPPGDEVDRIRIAVNGCRYLTARGRRTLVFAATVAGAVVLAEALRSVDIPSEAVHSGLDRTTRERRIKKFADGGIAVLTNQRLLATGYDCPAVSDVMLLTPVKSPILFEQMVGRAARGPRTGGSSVATIWEFDDHLRVHGYPQSYYRYRDYDWS